MTAVHLAGVAKSFGSQAVIAGLDLSINAGEFLVLVGPSGCGKSTTLRMIAGLEAPTSGRIRFGDRDVTALSPKDRGIAMVFQSYALYPHMTVRQNIEFSLRLAGLAPAEIARRVEDAARILGIAEHLPKKPGQLSGGQKQRVAIGRAMVRQPSVFLFDEPLSNLDAQLRVHMRTELAHLHRQLRTTSVYVTHDQVEAMTLADRIAVFNRGRIEQLGTPLEVFSRPLTRFVAGFIGTPGMNFFPAALLPPGVAPGGAVTAGVRPEAVSIGGAAATKVTVGAGRVRLVELLGTSAYVHLAVGGDHSLVSEVRGGSALPAMDAEVTVSVDPGGLRFFGGDDRTVGARP